MYFWMSISAAICLTATSSLAQVLRPADLDTFPSRAPQLRSAYGSDSLQFGELRMPKGSGPFPVAVVIHGGCWTRGHTTLKGTAAVASALTDDGIATWNIEYRQLGDPGAGWPNTFLDVGAGIDYLRTLAARYRLDLNRLVFVGHSAGAQLALWAAGRIRLPSTSIVRGQNPLPAHAVVAIDGPTDLAAWVGPDAPICGKPAIAPLMGGTPEAVPERYREGSPRAMLPLGVRQYLVGAVVLTAVEARAYETAARTAGDTVRVLVGLAGGHFGVIAPGTPFWPLSHNVILEAFGLQRQ
jgi:acetyl esterase/lipase